MNSLFSWARIVLPKISKTERIALQSGTVGLERLIFSGEMNKNKLNSITCHGVANLCGNLDQ